MKYNERDSPRRSVREVQNSPSAAAPAAAASSNAPVPSLPSRGESKQARAGASLFTTPPTSHLYNEMPPKSSYRYRFNNGTSNNDERPPVVVAPRETASATAPTTPTLSQHNRQSQEQQLCHSEDVKRHQAAGVTQLKPRLPRTSLSKIPRQVQGGTEPCDGLFMPTDIVAISPMHQRQQEQESVFVVKTPPQTESNSDTPEYQNHQFDHGSDETSSSTINIAAKSRYLTFSKDQATSHFKQLQEELNGSLAHQRQEQHEQQEQKPSCTPQQDRQQQMTVDISDRQPTYRHFRRRRDEQQQQHRQHAIANSVMRDSDHVNQFIDVVGLDEGDDFGGDKGLTKSSAFGPAGCHGSKPQPLTRLNDEIKQQQQQHRNQQLLQSQQQQPICEAFIMTGQSMLKLSCNETDNNNQTKTITKVTATTKQTNETTAISTTNSNNNNNNNNNNISRSNNNASEVVAASTTTTTTSSTTADPNLNRPVEARKSESPLGPDELSADKRAGTLPTRRFAPGSHAPSSTLTANSRRHLKQGLGKMHSSDIDISIEFKSGFLNRKRTFEAHRKPTSKGSRGWKRIYVILKDLRLIIRFNQQEHKQENGDNKQQQEKQEEQISSKQRKQMIARDMKNTVKVHHAFAKRSPSYTKREYVFQVHFADQSEMLMQASSEEEMDSWIETINFASACLSSPALPTAVSNSKRYVQRYQTRAILPSSYTKLYYWEQLIDHEERLQRLKQDLEEHLNEAPNTRNADIKSKSEFIEKIAYLRMEIERYSVYVDLMRKKSNSPEAIILSKHPQIASLTPSDEMIQNLPSFAPPKLGNGVSSSDKTEVTTTTNAL